MNNDFDTINSNSLKLIEVIKPSLESTLVIENIQKIMNQLDLIQT